MKKALFAASLALLLTLAACGDKTPAPGPSAGPASPAPPPVSAPPAATGPAVPAPSPSAAPVRPAAQWGEQRFDRLFTADDGGLIMTVAYAFPKIENGDHPAAGAVNDWYAQKGAELLETAGETAQWGTDDYKTAVQSGFSYLPFVEEVTFSITRETADYVSVRRELYANNGGAHPNVFAFSEQFALEDGHRLYFADFFARPDEAIPKIQAAVEAQAQAQGLEAGAASAAFVPEQFYLTGEGFVFWIQSGVLPAQNSPLEFSVPYEVLADQVSLW